MEWLAVTGNKMLLIRCLSMLQVPQKNLYPRVNAQAVQHAYKIRDGKRGGERAYTAFLTWHGILEHMVARRELASFRCIGPYADDIPGIRSASALVHLQIISSEISLSAS